MRDAGESVLFWILAVSAGTAIAVVLPLLFLI